MLWHEHRGGGVILDPPPQACGAFQLTFQFSINMESQDLLQCQVCGEDYTTCQCLEGIADAATSQSTSGSTSGDTSSRARHWCFTLNNPTQEEKQRLSEISTTSPGFQYMVYQLELGENETEHLQGYIEFRNVVRFNRVKSLISPRIHLEKRRGTREQARDYCMKEETRVDGPFEFGEWVTSRGQGFRTDLVTIRNLVREGKTEAELWEAHFETMVRYHRSIVRYKDVTTIHRDYGPVVHVLYGPTGTGKSKWVTDTFPGAYWKSQDQWWDGYESEESVVFDEFYGWIKYSILLRICDRYPLQLERKGGFVKFRSRNIIFTTNQEPSKWYPNISNFDAFIRRVSVWHYLPTIDDHHTITSYDTFKRLIEV